jgi:hypothetical protein
MAIISFPTSAVPDRASITLEANTSVNSSDLNRAVQTSEMDGARWRMVLTFGQRQGRPANALRGFLAALNGRANRFYYTPPDLENEGTAGDTGEVDGAGQTGVTLDTNLWPADQELLFAAGDYFEVNGELKIITEDIASDASGNAELKFAPKLRTSPANAEPIEVDDPRALMMLENDSQASWQATAPVVYGLSLSAVEDVTA